MYLRHKQGKTNSLKIQTSKGWKKWTYAPVMKITHRGFPRKIGGAFGHSPSHRGGIESRRGEPSHRWLKATVTDHVAVRYGRGVDVDWLVDEFVCSRQNACENQPWSGLLRPLILCRFSVLLLPRSHAESQKIHSNVKKGARLWPVVFSVGQIFMSCWELGSSSKPCSAVKKKNCLGRIAWPWLFIGHMQSWPWLVLSAVHSGPLPRRWGFTEILPLPNISDCAVLRKNDAPALSFR